MRRFLLLLALLALASPAAAQAVKCTESSNARALQPPNKGAQFVNGILKSWYVQFRSDSTVTTCTGFPTVVDSVPLLATRDTLAAAKATVKALQDSIAKLLAGTPTPPPPPVDTTPTPVPPPGPNAMYFNSAETGCGTDANVILCDDFEDGTWYEKNCDVANNSGGLLQTDGWCGTIWSMTGSGQPGGPPITPPAAARCGVGVGAKGTRCAADGGVHSGGQGGGNMADHNLGPNANGYTELWLRYYIKPLPGYVYGAQKMITFNADPAGTGGISIGGSGSPFGDGAYDTCPVYDCNFLQPGDPDAVYYYRQNQGSRYMLKDHQGVWTYVEMHIKLNTPGQKNGVWELWLNDCGAAGICTGTPTLRTRATTVQWQAPNANLLIRALWFENWANPGSTGTELYDQVKVVKAGPVGF